MGLFLLIFPHVLRSLLYLPFFLNILKVSAIFVQSKFSCFIFLLFFFVVPLFSLHLVLFATWYVTSFAAPVPHAGLHMNHECVMCAVHL